jgi:hypothetical protein
MSETRGVYLKKPRKDRAGASFFSLIPSERHYHV